MSTRVQFTCVEATLDLQVRPGLMIRMWIDTKKQIPSHIASEQAKEIEATIRQEYSRFADHTQLLEWLAGLPNVNAAQVLYDTDSAGSRIGVVAYTVPFEDLDIRG